MNPLDPKYTNFFEKVRIQTSPEAVRAGLGTSPGWGPYGPLWALMGPPGQVLAGPDMSDFRLLVDFSCFGFKIRFLTKFLNDSAWLLPEKLKKHVILIKNLNT